MFIRISNKWLETITKKKNVDDTTQTIAEDMHGKHTNRPGRTSEAATDSVHEHIALFPRVESHYCRESTSREYLHESLSISKMFVLYKVWAIENNKGDIVTEYRYRYIFNNYYNIFFHNPKKDQCDECVEFSNLTEEQRTGEIRNQNNTHLIHKNAARDLMKKDKQEALLNSSICCASFDLQKVLNTPKCETSVMYYKREVSIFNLREEGTGEAYFFYFRKFFFIQIYTSMYKN